MSVSIKISSSTDEIRPHTRWLNAYRSPVHAHVNFGAGECTPSDQTTCREKTPNHRHTSCACLDFVHRHDGTTDHIRPQTRWLNAWRSPVHARVHLEQAKVCRVIKTHDVKNIEKKNQPNPTPLRACLDFVFHGSDSITDTMVERVEVSCACTCPFGSEQT